MNKLLVINHYKGAPGLRLLGLGPQFLPCKGLIQLNSLLDKNTSWARARNLKELKKCLANSDVIISMWHGKEIVGFGRAQTDGIYRGVLWDIVIDKKQQGKGYGKIIVTKLLESKKIKETEKIYLMTTDKKDFYGQFGFEETFSQTLLIKYKSI